jgi:UDP-2,3-diacylglucosamine hydrolase
LIFGLNTDTPSPKVLFGVQGKLAALSDAGIPIYFFTGNHDMWMFDYFEKEIGIVIYRKPIELQINSHTFLIGHGDGLGPGDSNLQNPEKILQQ